MTLTRWQTFVTCVDLSENVCRLANCRMALPPRRTAYCSDKHAREFERNHVWLFARRAARRRAGWRCERCGFKPSEVRRDPLARRAYSRHELRLEVNHILPLKGVYRGVSCFNHQSNLEVLCHRCHLQVTREQREQE
ncbi:MAG TPA: hypothetical protein VG845_02730 [Dehalococcoidia bacterium]|nr:hypothetical protein [Dehalococcoidia bacterium]